MKTIFTTILLIITSLAYGQSFEVYVSDAGNFNNPPWQILKFDSTGQNPTIFINTNLNWPQDIIFLEDSNTVLISNLGSNKITKHDINTGAYLGNFATGISGPTRMKIGADGYLYVLQWSGNGFVKRYNLDGTFVDDFTNVAVTQSIGIDWDNAGNLYVSSYNGDYVRKFDNSGNDAGIFVNTNLLGPTNIWFDTNGNLLVVDYNGTAVKRFDNLGNYVNDFMTGLSNSEGVDFLLNGDILIGDGATKSVKQFDSTGTFIKDFIASGSGNLLTPNAVVIRNVTPTSTNEEKLSTPNIIYPTIGTEFFIFPEYIQEIQAIDIYNSTGQKIKSIENIETAFWNANEMSKGIYIIKVQFEDNVTHTIRLMVQ